jgi:excisionase family DNA binding protein
VKIVEKLLLTPQEAAEALSIGRSKLYELLGQGQLESVRVGSCRRIPIGSLIEFVSRLQTNDATPTGPTWA